MALLKRIRPWIACLAVLLNMLAMPLNRALQTPDAQLKLWGGFCSGGVSKALPPGFNKLTDPPSSRLHQKRLCNTTTAAVDMLDCPSPPPSLYDKALIFRGFVVSVV